MPGQHKCELCAVGEQQFLDSSAHIVQRKVNRSTEQRQALLKAPLGLRVRELGKILVEGTQIGEGLLLTLYKGSVCLVSLHYRLLTVPASLSNSIDKEGRLVLPGLLKLKRRFLILTQEQLIAGKLFHWIFKLAPHTLLFQLLCIFLGALFPIGQ